MALSSSSRLKHEVWWQLKRPFNTLYAQEPEVPGSLLLLKPCSTLSTWATPEHLQMHTLPSGLFRTCTLAVGSSTNTVFLEQLTTCSTWPIQSLARTRMSIAHRFRTVWPSGLRIRLHTERLCSTCSCSLSSTKIQFQCRSKSRYSPATQKH